LLNPATLYWMFVDAKVVLSGAELQFIQDLKAGRIDKYEHSYRRTLKHRILKKHKRLTFEALLISEILEDLQNL
jgi:hypothetical protein